MATAQDFLSYTGNANLSLGSNPNIPISNEKGTEFTNQILRDIALQNHQKNLLRYKQKIDERDKLYEALASGEIKIGDTLQQDMPTVNKALDEQTKAFQDWMQKGYGDINGAIDYRKATQKANEVTTQAQARKHYFDTENTAGQKELLPKYQQLRKEHLDKSLTNFWSDLTPFQETSKLDIGAIEKLAQPFQTEVTDPNRPLEKAKRTYFSYSDAAKKAAADLLSPQGSYNLSQFHDTLQEIPPIQLYTKVKDINKELQRYNTERGLQTTDSDFATPIQIVPQYDQQGNLIKLDLNEPLDKLAAKFSLAGQEKFQNDIWDVNKGKLDIAEQAERERHNKAMEAQDRSRLGLDWTKFNYAKDEDKFGASSVLNEAKDIIDKGVDTKIQRGDKTVSVLRIGDPTLLKTFGNIDKDGNVTNVPDAIDYDKEKDQVRLIFYRPSKTASGKNFIEKEVSLDQRTWLKEIAKRSFPNKDLGKINTLVDDILNKSDNSLYKLTQGGSETTLSQDAAAWKQEGKYWRYKDGRLFDAKGKEIKK